MAGMRTVDELLKLSPDKFEMTVFGAEPHGNYNRIMLSPVLAGDKQLSEIIINDLQWYQDNNITLHAGKTVNRVRASFSPALPTLPCIQLRTGRFISHVVVNMIEEL
jgi:NAD(P)H-nitrite reductase large subunit